MSKNKTSAIEGEDTAVAVAEQPKMEPTDMTEPAEQPAPSTVPSEDFITRIERIASSELAAKLRKMMKLNQHYVIIKQDNKEIMNLTRDGWSLVAAMFQINLSVVEETVEDIFDSPHHYMLLKDAYQRNLDKWLAGDLDADGAKRLNDIKDKMTSIYNMEIRPSRRVSMRVRVRAEFLPQHPGDPIYYREEVGVDIAPTGDLRSEFFKLTTRTCSRAIRNLIGGVCGDLVGSDEDLSTSSSKRPR